MSSEEVSTCNRKLCALLCSTGFRYRNWALLR